MSRDRIIPVDSTSTGDSVNAMKQVGKTLGGLIGFVVVFVGIPLGIMSWDGAADEREANEVHAALTEQGKVVQSVDCSSWECEAIIDGTTYIVTIQKDQDGDKVYGLSPKTATQ